MKDLYSAKTYQDKSTYKACPARTYVNKQDDHILLTHINMPSSECQTSTSGLLQIYVRITLIITRTTYFYDWTTVKTIQYIALVEWNEHMSE